ncbi:hypothetical protein N7465_008104 [Penicillium sp. CMV-2018d]|nr:hypothetical protein N7465_008104 [Penicillium sp. CMV-2018d]
MSTPAASASTSAAATAQPPHNRNWYDEEDITPDDQSVGLPEIGTFTLFMITPPPKHKVDLDNWLDKVEKILESHNLHNLIKKDVLWPHRDSENGQKWKTISKQELNSRGNKMSFADEFVDELKKLMKGEGHGALKAAMTKYRTISRSQYSTIEEYITAMKKTYKTLSDLKSRLVPYFALQAMLIELSDVPELESFIVLKDNELNAIKDPVETIRVIDFHQYCTAILDHIESHKAKAGIISAAVNNSRRQNTCDRG